MSETTSFCKTETLYPLNNSPSPPPPASWQLASYFIPAAIAVKTSEGEGWVGEWEWWSWSWCCDVTFYLLWCRSNLWFLVYLTSSCPVYQTEASWSSAFLHWRRRQWKSRRWLPRYSNRGPTSPPLPSPFWAEGSLWSWTGTNRRFS